MSLDTITPNVGPYTGGTPVVLGGDFSVVFNTGPIQATYEVFFSADQVVSPGDDEEGFVTSDTASTINGVTPGVDAPGAFNVYVRASNGVVSETSNMIPFTFTNTNETPAQTAARTIDDNFDAVDDNGDGLVSPAEAQAFGVGQVEFDQLDTDNDGFISQAEIDAALAPESACDQLRGLLGNFTIVGFLAVLLSIFRGFREALFSRIFPFPGNPNPRNDDEQN